MCLMKMTMVNLVLLQLLCTVCVVLSQAASQQQQQQYSTPVPILQQINRQNEDGSYTYGYKNADGSYKIETKSAIGEVEGEYGYVDETGKLRQIKYGASSSRGFEPAGPGITVPPPTLHVQNSNAIEDYDDGQYREDPSIYYKTDQPPLPKRPLAAVKSAPLAPAQLQPAAAPAPVNFRYETPAAPAPYNWYRPESQAAAAAYNPAVFQGHPATNFDPFTGSYTINYSG